MTVLIIHMRPIQGNIKPFYDPSTNSIKLTPSYILIVYRLIVSILSSFRLLLHAIAQSQRSLTLCVRGYTQSTLSSFQAFAFAKRCAVYHLSNDQSLSHEIPSTITRETWNWVFSWIVGYWNPSVPGQNQINTLV